MWVLFLVGGLFLLFVGGHYLVLGATRLALLARVPAALVALTIVAMGTSFPELAVSVGAALRHSTDIAYGNVVGSNIVNVGAILALSILVGPMIARGQTVRIEYPFMLVVTCVALLLARDGVVDRVEGIFFLLSLALFMTFVVRLTRVEVGVDEAEWLGREARRTAHLANGAVRAWGGSAGLVVGGLVALVVGADLAVRGAVDVARVFGVTERVIGLTIVAMGTSLPELATSVVAAHRRETEIAVGNIIGSNIFNLLGILGATAVIIPVPVDPRSVTLDNWVMLAFAGGLLPMVFLRGRLTRWHGVLLLAGFFGYWGVLILQR
jgi:cation:H+ antiporter